MPKTENKVQQKDLDFYIKAKVKMPQSGKEHGMIKRTNSQIRKQRGTNDYV